MSGNLGINLRHVGINLKHVRKHIGATQLAPAQRAGPPFTQALISLFERGLQPSTEHIQQLATALDVPVKALLRRPRLVRRKDALQAIVVEGTAVADVNTRTAPEGGLE